jgi:hypothetical protein
MCFRTKIEKTNYYKKLNFIQRENVMKRPNRLKIEHGYQVAQNIGLEQWERQSAFNLHNSEIIKEIVENETIKNI